MVDTVNRFHGRGLVAVIDTVADVGDKLGMFYAETGL